jgi:hypothetical protein
MKKLALIGLAAAAVLLASACTNDEGENESPVTLTVNLPEQPLVISVSAPAPVQIPEINLESRLKNPTATDPQGFATVQVNIYRVRWSRRDGGTRVPATEEFAAAVVVQAGGNATLNGFPIMSASALQRSPLDQLLPFNGGVDRETGLNEMHLFYELVFFGTTVSGHRVESEAAIGDLFFTP